ncbi:hypothetical protein BDB01DRAFT_722028, partial [Pilobolus umbonatus]
MDPLSSSKEEILTTNPPFIFELRSDKVHLNGTHEPFSCVYDFCRSLENFCTKFDIDIELGWKNLLVNCSSHNSDRLTWIYLNLERYVQQLSWKQVMRRLMHRFDNPDRVKLLKTALQQYRYDPHDTSKTVDCFNRNFYLCIDEL